MNTILNMQLASQRDESAGMDHLSSPNEKPKKGNKIKVDEITLSFEQDSVIGRQILQEARKLPVECYSLYQKLKGHDFEKVGLDEIIDLLNPGIEQFITKEADIFHYRVNNECQQTDQKTLTPQKIMELAGIVNPELYLVQLNKDGTETVYAYLPSQSIKMHCDGMQFITRQWLAVVDIEEYGKDCKPVPPARQYLIRVDKNKYPWPNYLITAKELIGLEIKGTATGNNLLKFYSHDPKPVQVGLEETIDLTEKCLVRFVIQPKTQDDGERKDFSLPEEDTDFLNKMGFQWEALREGRYMWLFIHEYSIPEGYNVEKASVALMIPPSYPALQIDMAYFFPQLKKKSGCGINALTQQTIDGKIFQRWSRHRKSGEWKPGVDNVSTHLTLVNNWLVNDLKR